jgi:ribosomal protein S18 acetylase RimI-like enzyme
MEDGRLDIRIVPCTMAEVETLEQIAYETFDETFRVMNTAETMEKYLEEAFNRERLLEELSNPKSTFFFKHTDNKLSGYLKLNEAPAQSDLNDANSLELERIYVRKEFRGKGLGKVLIEYAIQIARQRGKRYIWLGVWERNADAIVFYRRMGFTIAGYHAFRMGSEIQRDLIMKKVFDE